MRKKKNLSESVTTTSKVSSKKTVVEEAKKEPIITPSEPIVEVAKDILLEEMGFKDGKGNEFKVFLYRGNKNRTLKTVYCFNGMEVKPATYTGANSGYAFWNLLKEKLHK